MVSLWPWRRDDSSPASFEKALSKLSEQITKSNIRLDASRTRSRRIKALWTLYTSIAYLVYTIILSLVIGVNKWNVWHYAGVLGAPIVIFLVRKLATVFYDWRMSSEQAHLDDLVKQRDTTIERLKNATKYNSTQELLNKYGGSTPRSTPSGKGQPGSGQKKKSTPTPTGKSQLQTGRTGIAPPPTANIPGRAQQPSTPARPAPSEPGSGQAPSPPNVPFVPEEPGFAPNAFSTSSQSYPQASSFQPQSPHWYDRILDVLLGEDETLPKNRLALICSNCRLVNGQAPPGVKDVDDVGKWRCGGCGAWNGEESEAKKALEAMKRKEELDRKKGWHTVSRGDEIKSEGDHDSTPSDRAARKQTRDVIPSSDAEDEEDEDDEMHDVADEQDEDEDAAALSKRVTRSASKPNDHIEL